MDTRRYACLSAALAMGVSLAGIAAGAAAAPPMQDVVVKGDRIDPVLQRKVTYHDLNLAVPRGQRMLQSRIYRTAGDLCFDLNGSYFTEHCTDFAVRSTDGQVAQAIARAKRQMAGLPVGPAITISMVIGGR
ncbi:UrcA family protein [Sphingomonas humi]|uniref:UrcA family protein n=1 Tax=Sphingomonas humi TaxID=335630 RepID=A0ABP7RIZ7_9SPHN